MQTFPTYNVGLEATRMCSLLWIAAVGAFLGVMVLWDLVMITAFRLFRIRLPFSTAFRFPGRKERDLLAALRERPENTYVLISFLLIVCPLFAGFTAYDLIARRYIDHSKYGLDQFVGLIVIFVVFSIGGVRTSISTWRKFSEASR